MPIDRRAIVAFLVAAIGYAAASTWWAASLATRVEVNTHRITTLEEQFVESRADRRSLDNRLTGQEQLNRAQIDILNRIQHRIDEHVLNGRSGGGSQ